MHAPRTSHGTEQKGRADRQPSRDSGALTVVEPEKTNRAMPLACARFGIDEANLAWRREFIRLTEDDRQAAWGALWNGQKRNAVFD